ncbi:hypothetical protein [Xanthomarina spongicola]|uniref:Uncharacterized protein n=1 Tax=Xanthomarina spongicola TaxID=570520 RepID=A0A316DWC3_9FLAO|nr:hypothetical protein [Xanthomarina spongicola]PWK20883.1 hypothetical protein LX78_00590 [Xanthomarina spongicola]
MNSIKITLSIFLFTLVTTAYGQNIKIKKDVITIDDQLFGIIEDDKSVRGSFYINGTNENNLLYFKWVVYGSLNYYEIYEANNLDNILFEENAVMGFKKYMVKRLFNAGVLTPSGIDEDKLSDFSKKMGKEFTRIRENGKN